MSRPRVYSAVPTSDGALVVTNTPDGRHVALAQFFKAMDSLPGGIPALRAAQIFADRFTRIELQAADEPAAWPGLSRREGA